MSQPEASPAVRPLRTWVPVVLLVAMIACREIPPRIEDAPPGIWMIAAFGPLICCGLVILWWLFASRAARRERLHGFGGLLVAAFLCIALADATMRGPVMMNFTLPMGVGGFALGAILCSRSPRRVPLAVLLSAVGFLPTVLVRSEGLKGASFTFELRSRFAPTAEELMLAEAKEVTDAPGVPAFDPASPAWPGFRGPDRDGSAGAVAELSDDWSTAPELLWKVRIGPGWSSFALAGSRLFTMEQRGDREATVCLDATTGERIWVREVDARFEDSLGGPGPRATPTLADGALYVLGASGNLARLDPRTGAVVWEQDLSEVAGTPPPMWGFSASPLVVDGLVVVHAGGEEGEGVFAFRAESGELAWSAASGNHSYSSPQAARLLDDDVILMLTNRGLDVLDPSTGEILLAIGWETTQYRATQPHVVDGDLLLPSGPGTGSRRVRLANDGGTWTSEEVWTAGRLKVDFNDFVVYAGHAYGFDGPTFVCTDLTTGERVWKGGRYGTGQVVLIPATSRLLVTAETGEVVLLAAEPGGHRELGRFQALEGKTWNHPVLVGDLLFVRNSEQAAAFRLP